MGLTKGCTVPLKDGESDVIVHCRHDAIPRMKRIFLLMALPDVERPVSHCVSLGMGLGPIVKRQKGHRLTCI